MMRTSLASENPTQILDLTPLNPEASSQSNNPEFRHNYIVQSLQPETVQLASPLQTNRIRPCRTFSTFNAFITNTVMKPYSPLPGP